MSMENSVGTCAQRCAWWHYDAQKIILRRIAVSLGYCSREPCCGRLTLTPCSIPSGSFADIRASRIWCVKTTLGHKKFARTKGLTSRSIVHSVTNKLWIAG